MEKTTVSDSNASVNENVKKRDEKRIKLTRTKVNELHSPDSRKTSGVNLGKHGAKGKVKDFVMIFNQESVLKPKTDADTQSRSSRRKSKGTFPADGEESATSTKTNETNHVPIVNNMKTPQNVPVMVNLISIFVFLLSPLFCCRQQGDTV